MGDYVKGNKFLPEDHVHQELGNILNVSVSPHDLRRYSAIYASRNGVPLEKVIMRHQDLKTTQNYLDKVSEHEAIRWMDILHGK